jgi:GNAT superfamily N-acetyltransferase
LVDGVERDAQSTVDEQRRTPGARLMKRHRETTASGAQHMESIQQGAIEIAPAQTHALTDYLRADLIRERQRATTSQVDHPALPDIRIRLAMPNDVRAIQCVVEQALRVLGAADYSQQQIESTITYLAGTDAPDLIADATYYVADVQNVIVGCGGWSKRRALYSDAAQSMHSAQQMLDPAHDAAKIRQFFVDPHWTRRGIARRLLQPCEHAAHAHGFTRLELAATLTGEPLYRSYGFERVAPLELTLPDGVVLPVITMVKRITMP